jgi:hypothetical protein
MTTSRNGKGKANPGRCVFWPTFPQRQPRRICEIHPGLVSLPGSQSVLETPDRAGLSPRLYPAAGAPGGRVVERVGSDATASFLHLDRRSAKHAGQHLTETFGSVAPSIIGFAHGSHHEGNHAHEVVKACPEFGNVCRVFGN